MKSYHLAMHTLALSFSAVLFKSASWVLGRAVHHKGRMRSFGAHPPARDPGFLYPDEPVEFEQPVIYQTIIKSPNVWAEADPCSDYDPIHPDYVPYSEK